MSANEDEGQRAILHKVASGWRRSGSNERAGKSAKRGAGVRWSGQQKVTPPVHKHGTRQMHMDICARWEHDSALQLICRRERH